jgi:hypothetical protein
MGGDSSSRYFLRMQSTLLTNCSSPLRLKVGALKAGVPCTALQDTQHTAQSSHTDRHATQVDGDLTQRLRWWYHQFGVTCLDLTRSAVNVDTFPPCNLMLPLTILLCIHRIPGVPKPWQLGISAPVTMPASNCI